MPDYPTDSAEDVKMARLSPLHCQQCGHLIGYTTQTGWLVTEHAVHMGGPFMCRHCGHLREWVKPIARDEKLERLIRNVLLLRQKYQ